MAPKIPRDRSDDYTREAAAARRRFAAEQAGASLEHVGSFSLDPASLPGNIEHFTGVAQVPIGLAGPLLVDGEHARGEFYVPLATTEGTLVASYNRGMKLLHAAGGVRVTVVEDHMQRAPAFPMDDARGARALRDWIAERFGEIAEAAQATTSVGVLERIETYVAGRFLYCRFDYSTGDAAGQNMTGKATWAACEWIKANYDAVREYQLEAQLATDKKHSHINTLMTRGKRVVAEVTIPDELLREQMNTSSRALFDARQISHLGARLAQTVNNGAHAANALAAIFIATGQDAANVAESHAGLVHVELRENDDYYYSITLPSLIVATHGGGTGLATQRECLELLGCVGPGTAVKLAEIMAATVLCGELSLGSAIVADEWVEAHDKHGRNR
ncbi:MAG: hydroxymethylglutaryl-CoA reductase [Baekduia sp.]